MKKRPSLSDAILLDMAAIQKRARHAARIKAYRERRRLKGLCPYCGAKQKKPVKAVKK